MHSKHSALRYLTEIMNEIDRNRQNRPNCDEIDKIAAIDKIAEFDKTDQIATKWTKSTKIAEFDKI